jgi:DNA-nicking Smr family endonuclease
MTIENTEDDPPVEIPVDGTLDLHAFSPKDIKFLVPDYLDLCHSAGIYQVRIIHGKGVGHLRRSVHAILARHPLVRTFTLAGQDAGSWGATLVELRPRFQDLPPDKS